MFFNTNIFVSLIPDEDVATLHPSRTKVELLLASNIFDKAHLMSTVIHSLDGQSSDIEWCRLFMAIGLWISVRLQIGCGGVYERDADREGGASPVMDGVANPMCAPFQTSHMDW